VRDRADAVEAERNVRSLAQRVHPSRAKRDLLAADAKDRGGRRRRGDCDIDEGLVQIELVLVDHRSRSAESAVLET